jgi:hypothetical protein
LPGLVKTRLIPALGAAGAAQLARQMLDHTLQQAQMAGIGPVELCASPSITASDWAGYPLPHGVETSEQGEGDLGARMARACRQALTRNPRVLLIGTDCPGLTTLRLRTAGGCAGLPCSGDSSCSGWRISLVGAADVSSQPVHGHALEHGRRRRIDDSAHADSGMERLGWR